MQNELELLFDRLFPINRSLTGEGNRESLKILSEVVDLQIYEVPSGTRCFDWTIPQEWNVKEAWIKDSTGKTIVNFKDLNLHLLGYSIPFQGQMTLNELKPHLFSIPEMPESVPYLTSYYKERWGFCLKHSQLLELKNDTYEVLIDSELNKNGAMTFGEAFIKGESEKEVLFSTYICHPSLANNELSGPLVTSFIYKLLKGRKLRYSYRFLFLPETIGAIYYLSKYGKRLKDHLIAGFVVTTIGDSGQFTYKRSRIGNSLPDRAVEKVLNETEKDYIIEDFFPNGSDERQYCSPGFNLPVGSLMRTRYGKYKEYHTSDDNKSFISFDAMQKSVEKYIQVVDIIEKNRIYLNQSPFCEPQLGKRGLYPTLGSQKEVQEYVDATLWLLNLSDGTNDLISISKQSKINFNHLEKVAEKLLKHGLIQEYNNQ